MAIAVRSTAATPAQRRTTSRGGQGSAARTQQRGTSARASQSAAARAPQRAAKPVPVRERETSPTAALRVVRSRRRALRFGVVLGLFLFGAMLAVTAFQTQLAQNQLEVDRVEDRIAAERARYDQLRLESASLRTPERLSAAAAELGMTNGGNTEFVPLDPNAAAAAAVATGQLPDELGITPADPLERYAEVKSGVDGAP